MGFILLNHTSAGPQTSQTHSYTWRLWSNSSCLFVPLVWVSLEIGCNFLLFYIIIRCTMRTAANFVKLVTSKRLKSIVGQPKTIFNPNEIPRLANLLRVSVPRIQWTSFLPGADFSSIEGVLIAPGTRWESLKFLRFQTSKKKVERRETNVYISAMVYQCYGTKQGSGRLWHNAAFIPPCWRTAAVCLGTMTLEHSEIRLYRSGTVISALFVWRLMTVWSASVASWRSPLHPLRRLSQALISLLQLQPRLYALASPPSLRWAIYFVFC